MSKGVETLETLKVFRKSKIVLENNKIKRVMLSNPL